MVARDGSVGASGVCPGLRGIHVVLHTTQTVHRIVHLEEAPSGKFFSSECESKGAGAWGVLVRRGPKASFQDVSGGASVDCSTV